MDERLNEMYDSKDARSIVLFDISIPAKEYLIMSLYRDCFIKRHLPTLACPADLL